MNDYLKYESLPEIEPQMMISIMEKTNQGLSDKTVPIPQRIESINLLRSLRKFQFSYFVELFGALRSKFLKNCLHYEENPRLQQISLDFINEIFDNDDPYSVSNDMVYDLYDDILRILECSKNNLIKEKAKFTIKTLTEKVVNDAKIVVLIETLKSDDDSLCQFIYECFKKSIENLRGLVYLNYNFSDIIEKLNLEDASEKYFDKVKHVFQILINNLEACDREEIINNLKQKDDIWEMFQRLTSN